MTQFYGQFVLHKRPEPLRPEWRHALLSEWTLETHPALPVTFFRVPSGMLLGYPISQDGEYLPKSVDPSNWFSCGRGRYIAMISKRIYLDAIGSMACVYSTEQQCIASSPLLIPGATMDEEIVQAYGMPESGKFYPAGLTPFRGVERLLPNHYLDLETMKVHRHWPLQDFKHKADTDQLVAEIAERLTENISAVVRKQPAYLSLTAGRDSRMLLAAARGVLDRIIFITYDDAPVDMHIAERIAKRHQLSWRPLQESTTHDWGVMEDWQHDVGNCVSGAIWEHSTRFYHLSNRLFPPERVRMPGLAGEIGRAYYWRKGDRATTPECVTLLDRMKLPTDHKPTLDHMARWADSVPPWLNTYDILDLAYIEHRLGCWGGPSLYGSDRYFAGQVVPLGDRYIIERMMSLPPEYRLAQRMAPDVIRYAWPELLELPFNRYTGMMRYISRHSLRQVARLVKRVVKG